MARKNHTRATRHPLPPESQKAKGNLVEDIVALLHGGTDTVVERNVKLPVLGKPKRRREIDVLITGRLSGYPVRIAIECKNYATPVTVGQVGEFRDRLEEVGIPPQHGIMVAANGYTNDALDRAETIGIRALVLTGLTSDRITTEVHEAFQAVVFLLLDVMKVEVTCDVAEDPNGELLLLVNEAGEPQGFLPDLIWAKWRDGEIPLELGEYELSLEPPSGWRWAIGGDTLPTRAVARVAVLGLVITIPGRAEWFDLSEAASGVVERTHIRASFDAGSKSYPVLTVRTEEEVETILNRPAAAKLTSGRIVLPRIRYTIYWPPSERAMRQLARLAYQFLRQGTFGISKVTNEEIEGTDLVTIWEPIARSHPSVSDPDWPYTPVV